MSTKIYNGYLLDVSGLSGLMTLRTELRSILRETLSDAWAGEVVSKAVSAADSVALGRSPFVSLVQADVAAVLTRFSEALLGLRSTLDDARKAQLSGGGRDLPGWLSEVLEQGNALNQTVTQNLGDETTVFNRRSLLQGAAYWTRMANLESMRTGRHVSGLDVETSLVAFLDDQTGQVYAMLYADNQLLRDACSAHPALTPYAYWDSTDPPDDVSEAEWAERGALWGRLLGPDGIPGKAGVTLSLTDFWDIPSDNLDAHSARAALAAVPDRHTRAITLARPPYARHHSGPGCLGRQTHGGTAGG